MAFIGKILQMILPGIVTAILDWGKGQYDKYQARKKSDAESEKKNADIADQMEKAQTPQEIEDAAKNTIGGF
jgi:hypothetical protein